MKRKILEMLDELWLEEAEFFRENAGAQFRVHIR